MHKLCPSLVHMRPRKHPTCQWELGFDRGVIAVMPWAKLAEEGGAPIACDQGSIAGTCFSGLQVIAFGFAPQLRAAGPISGRKA
jgi:hypothetical protein